MTSKNPRQSHLKSGLSGFQAEQLLSTWYAFEWEQVAQFKTTSPEMILMRSGQTRV